MRPAILIATFALVVALPSTGVRAQDAPAAPVVSGSSHVLVGTSIHNDVSPPLRSLAPSPSDALRHAIPPPRAFPPLPAGSTGQTGTPLQTHLGTAVLSSPIANFDGLGDGFSGPQGTFSVNITPPDANGDVGRHDYVQAVNAELAVFNTDAKVGRVGAVRYGPAPLGTLWAGFRAPCDSDHIGVEPIVLYDALADRWFIAETVNVIDPTGPRYLCVAVSTTGDPTGAYYRFAIPSLFSKPFGGSFSFELPKFAIWPDGYYATFNVLDGSGFVGVGICAFDRSNMLAGKPANSQCYGNFGIDYCCVLPSSVEGTAPPPDGSPNYLLALHTTSSLIFWRYHVDWTNPANTALSGPTEIPVDSFALPCNGGHCVPQAGVADSLDSVDDRLMYRLAYRNFGDHESLVVNHTVTAGSSSGIRWYEVRLSQGAPSLYQQGTYAPDGNYRWMGNLAMDRADDIGLGFSVSGSSIHPQVHYTGRLAGDPLGTMGQGEGTLIDGAGSQTGGSAPDTWGYYSSMSVDPVDGCTFWYTNEYIPANGNFNWHTRIGSFTFPGCGSDFSISASSSSRTIPQGDSVTYSVNTAVTAGSAQSINLSGDGLPAGATASFSRNPITAGQSSTMTITVGASTPTGTFPLAIQGKADSGTHFTSVSLSVTPNTPPTLTTSSLAPQAAYGAPLSLTVTARDPDLADTLTFRPVSGLPPGLRAVLPAPGAGPRSITIVGAGPGNRVTAAAGTYQVVFAVSDGVMPDVSLPVSITVTKQVVTLAPVPSTASSNPLAPVLGSGTPATSGPLTFSALIKEAWYGIPSQILANTPFTVSLTRVVTNGMGVVPRATSCTTTGTAVSTAGATSILTGRCLLNHVPVGVYDVQMVVGNSRYFQGSYDTVLTVYDSSLKDYGSGSLLRSISRTVKYEADFGFLARPCSRGAGSAKPQGGFVYIEHRPSGAVIVQGSSGSLTNCRLTATLPQAMIAAGTVSRSDTLGAAITGALTAIGGSAPKLGLVVKNGSLLTDINLAPQAVLAGSSIVTG